jgi:hypothetical protein
MEADALRQHRLEHIFLPLVYLSLMVIKTSRKFHSKIACHRYASCEISITQSGLSFANTAASTVAQRQSLVSWQRIFCTIFAGL